MARDYIMTWLVTLADGQQEKVQAIRPWITYGALIFCGPDEQLKLNGKEVTPRPGEHLKAFAPGHWQRYELVMSDEPELDDDTAF